MNSNPTDTVINIVDEIDEIDELDDNLDEDVLPKKTEKNVIPVTPDTSDAADILNDPDKLKFLELFNSLQSKDPKEIRKMFSKMGINEQQMKQMKSAYENASNDTTETDPRKRLREKLNKKRMMRMNNNIKQDYIEKQDAKKNPDTNEEVKSEVNPETKDNVNPETNVVNLATNVVNSATNVVNSATNVVNLATKKTLQNRKKAERKKEKARAQKATTFNSV